MADLCQSVGMRNWMLMENRYMKVGLAEHEREEDKPLLPALQDMCETHFSEEHTEEIKNIFAKGRKEFTSSKCHEFCNMKVLLDRRKEMRKKILKKQQKQGRAAEL